MGRGKCVRKMGRKGVRNLAKFRIRGRNWVGIGRGRGRVGLGAVWRKVGILVLRAKCR